jgi:hypothetical protein
LREEDKVAGREGVIDLHPFLYGVGQVEQVREITADEERQPILRAREVHLSGQLLQLSQEWLRLALGKL